jgi:hypothetical protein
LIGQMKELTQAQQDQIVKWKDTINKYEAKGGGPFSPAKIQELLDEIQDFVRFGLPDHLYIGVKKVTNAIYEVSLILAEPKKDDTHFQKATHLLCLAIKELCG